MTFFFDLDGTLIDSRADIALSVNRTRADYQLPPLPLEEITGMVGNGMRQLMLRAMPDHTDIIDELMRSNKHYYAQDPVVHTTAYPGVAEALAQLRTLDCKIAVCSNKTSVLIPVILERLGLWQYIDVAVGGGDVEHLKPAPDLLLLAYQKLGVSRADEDWIIGDNYTDLAAGKTLNLHVCQCAYGFGNPRNETFEMQVKDLREFAQAMHAKYHA